MSGLIRNHPFVDGNKRIAFEAMNLMLLINGADLVAGENEKYSFVIKAAKGKLTDSQINSWIGKHIK